MTFELPDLPFDKDALEPHISAETFEYHYGKHHQAYVTNLNNLTAGTDDANVELEQLIMTAEGGLFNNASQVWNHTFYWNCMSPTGGGAPTGTIADAINAKWGDFDSFKAEFAKAAIGNFGSGWTWLLKNTDGSLEIFNTSNAGSPLLTDKKPLLTIDVWEHAYYIDHRNARPNYVDMFWNIINWNFVNKNFTE